MPVLAERPVDDDLITARRRLLRQRV